MPMSEEQCSQFKKKKTIFFSVKGKICLFIILFVSGHLLCVMFLKNLKAIKKV